MKALATGAVLGLLIAVSALMWYGRDVRIKLDTELARPERCVMVVDPPEVAVPFLLIPETGLDKPPGDFVISYLCGKNLKYHFPNPTGEVANPFDTGDFN